MAEAFFAPLLEVCEMHDNNILEMQNITKYFPGVIALKCVKFSVARGEIHGLVGENGAGKSTLIKVLTGILHHDDGAIEFNDQSINKHTPLQIQKMGISTIYQELNLIPELSVAENIFLGCEPKKLGMIDWKAIYKKAKDVMDDLNIDIDVKKPISSYGTAMQQMVAIARAVTADAKLVVMDEPTSSLDTKEVKVLFELIERLKSKNVAIIFISHNIDEVFDLCSKISIMRDGEMVGTYASAEMDHIRLVSIMIGQDASKILMGERNIQLDREKGETLLKAECISSGMKLKKIDFEIGQGEGVGIAGLLGSGRTEFANIVFGVDSGYQGSLGYRSKVNHIKNPRQAIKDGIAFLSEDRKVQGIIPNMTIKENVTLANLKKISKWGIISLKKEKEITKKYIDLLRIKTPGMNQKIKNLSGGNQQKVLLARWLSLNPQLFILDEPTRGIDVGAKAEIINIINDLLTRKISVLMISSEINELQQVCDRIVIFRNGSSVCELKGDEIVEERIVKAIAESEGTGGVIS